MTKTAQATKQASQALLKKIMPSILGGVITSGGLDYISHSGDYSNISKGRIANAIFNAVLGGMGGRYVAKGNHDAGIKYIVSAPVKDVALAAVPAVHGATKAINNYNKQKKDAVKEAIKDLIIPGAAIGVTGLGVAAAIPALHNINRAADRIADGRSIRMSTSIRKRRNEPSDLKLEIMTPEQANIQAAQDAQELEEQKRKELEQKGFLQRIFG